jgi:hypothetical protein
MREDQSVDDKDTPEKYKIERKADSAIDGFYEFHFPKFTLGGRVAYEMVPESTKVSSGVKTKRSDKATNLGFTFYAPVYLTEKMTLLPSLSATSIDNKQDSGRIKSATLGSLSCAFRFTF